MPKRKRVRKVIKAKSNKNWLVASAVIILIVLFAVVMLMPNEPGITNTTPTQEEKQPSSTVISSGDACVRDSQCFSASCRSTPSLWECVNVTGQDIYYKNCNVYSNVSVVQDPSRCACVQGRCTAVR